MVNLGASKADVSALTAMFQGIEGVMTFGNGDIELWNRYDIVQGSGAMVMDAGRVKTEHQ